MSETNFEVTAWNRFAVILAKNYTENVGLDLGKWSLVYGDRVIAEYVSFSYPRIPPANVLFPITLITPVNTQ